MSHNDERRLFNRKFIYIGCTLLFLLVVGGSILAIYPFSSKEQVEYFHSEHPIIYKTEVFEGESILLNNQYYVSLRFFKEHIDPTGFFDEQSRSMIITTDDKVLQVPEEELSIFINEEPFTFEIPVLTLNEQDYFISLELVEMIYALETNVVDETTALFIREDGEEVQYAVVADSLKEHEARLRVKETVTSPFTAEVMIDERVIVEQQNEEFVYVRKLNGVAGFIKRDHITLDLERERIVVEVDGKGNTDLPIIDGPINLTWEAVYTETPSASSLPELPGVNVVSPTWFKLKNGEGNISNLGSLEYMEWARDRGFQVWGLFSNDFDPDLTNEALSSFETRQNMIRQLIYYSQLYGLDGINVDFENVFLKDKDLVTQFMRELTPYLHRAGLIVSMDITFISASENWSMFYDRVALSSIVDYMIVMAYDEHWATSPQSGSVASLPWVEQNVLRLLEEVPNEKLVLGIPFYARLWTEQTTDGGNVEVSSQALSMNEVQEWIKERGLTPTYDIATGQYYVEFIDESEEATYKIWIEDETSIEKRVAISQEHKLAGVASWARHFANDAAWKHLNQVLHSKSEK
ncbi:glycosyl hydrolase family 18 protein [Alkalihalobacterium chitinilyticum]|uniref:Glycosyl hydrolase family 18 protein n=1 Tax=Alkalihalobacterium chitinilyticum TaxID=2980103 RepID=A0ABT5VG18_9BACI|nr:glycosyl hydrolase family 18 protein [Alkalihalobacterium chitinilyticum]MDE5414413.1 glycosyl hydrolase family 18 protein [Alkalihalobacterium chitinilyticum]